MKGKVLAIARRTTKTNKLYYIVNMDGVGRVTSWEALTVGKTYEFDIVEKNDYKNMKNIFETIPDNNDEVEALKAKIKQLEEQVAFLKDLVRK